MTRISKELTHLEAVGLIKLVQTHPELEYLFRHGLIQEAAYNSLLFEDRKKLHRQVGEAIEQSYPNRLEEWASTLADHFVKAEEFEKAVRYLLLAGDQARGLYAHQEAIKHYQQALELLKKQDDYERAARTLMKLGLTYHNAFDFKQSRQAYDEGFALWQQTSEIAPGAPPPPAPHALRLAWGDPPTLDPTMAEDSTSGIIIGQLFRGLVELSPDMNVLPEVARNWEVLEGGRKYIFHLRNDVRWSDDTLVTAGDFEFAWKRSLDAANGSPHASLLYDIKGARAFHQGQVSDPNHVRVHALDETTLIVELEEPASYFLPLLAHSVAYPLPRHVVKVHGPAWTTIENLVTNGPFKLEKSWNGGESMVLSRNRAYSGRFMGNVEKVELIFLWDHPSSSAKMFKMYEVDGLDVFYLDSKEVGQAQRQYPGEYISFPAQWTTYVGFNLNRPPFDNPQVRQAIAMAVDRETWTDVHLEGNAPPATGGFVPLGIPGHSAGIGLPYDPDLARHFLALAGYPKGFGFPIVDGLIRFGQESVAEYLQAQWLENLGIEIRWEILEWVKLVDQLSKEPPSIYYTGWLADYDDPDSFLRGGLHQDSINWQDATYDSLIEEARRVTNQQTRLELYRQADKILVTEAVIIPFTYGRLHLLLKPWLSKFPRSRSSDWHWKNVIIEPH